jgi:NAD(P)-dependent dehydrogenase (short-subunit alcohol dehydrogenase family)
MDRLANKVALVFGAGPNFGGTIAHFLAREGAKVAVVDIKAENAAATQDFLASRGYESLAITGDASDTDDIRRSVDKTIEHFGGLDIAVNIAGVLRVKPLEEMSLGDWNQSVRETLTPGMVTNKYVLEAMTKLGTRGSLIHLLSSHAHWGQPNRPAYSAMKAGLLNMARAAAMEVAHLGIRVNTITPIGMEHNIWKIGLSNAPRTRYSFDYNDVLKMVPLGRLPRASDIAWAVVFLASDVSSFITGADIPVDGGVRAKYPMWMPGAFTGLNEEAYLEGLQITEYGEPVRDFKKS